MSATLTLPHAAPAASINCSRPGCISPSFLPPLCTRHYRETNGHAQRKLEEAAAGALDLLQEVQELHKPTGELGDKIAKALILLKSAKMTPVVPTVKTFKSAVSAMPEKEKKATDLAAMPRGSGPRSSVGASSSDSEVFKWIMSEYNHTTQHAEKEEGEEDVEALVGNHIAKAFAAHLQQAAATRRMVMLSSKYTKTEEERREWMASQSVLVQIEYRLLSFTVIYLARYLTNWSFDIFRWETATDGYPLSVMLLCLLERHNFFHEFNLSRNTMAKWISSVEQAYLDNPYHNKLHGADVLRIMYYWCTSKEMSQRLSKTELLAALLAASVHDVGHPGTNNRFEVDTGSDLAWIYNDQSVLEHMHCSTAFRMMREPGMNIFENWDSSRRQQVRRLMIEMVLATDMSHHFDMVGKAGLRIEEEKMKLRLQASNASSAPSEKPSEPMLFSNPSHEEKSFLLKLMIHTSDISTPAEITESMYRWAEGVIEEFHTQGDMERKLGLPVMAMMDRTKSNREEGQIGFIDAVVKPIIETMEALAPEATRRLLEQLAINRNFWVEKKKARDSHSSSFYAESTKRDHPKRQVACLVQVSSSCASGSLTVMMGST
eukprot:g82259.t1